MSEVGQPFVSNEFGTVYADRIAFNSKKGWFGGGSLEELPIRHVTSVKLETSRNVVGGVLLLLIGFPCLFSKALILGLVFIALAALVLWGSPRVRVNTAGGDLRPSSGLPWHRAAAQEFVAGVRKALFDKP